MTEPPDDAPAADTSADEAQRWLSQASEELATARRLSEDPDAPARIACFLAHLAAEKSMKAWLMHRGIAYRRVHDLAELLALMPSGAADEIDVGDLKLLNPWIILGRYPDDVGDATLQQAEACVAAAGRVVHAAKVAIQPDP